MFLSIYGSSSVSSNYNKCKSKTKQSDSSSHTIQGNRKYSYNNNKFGNIYICVCVVGSTKKIQESVTYIVTLFTIRHYTYIVPVYIRSTASHYVSWLAYTSCKHMAAKPFIVTFPPNVPMR